MDYNRYEVLKATWIAKHPNASPRQYEKAMKSIARKCGV